MLAGCRPEQFKSTIDCGVQDALLDRPRVQHVGVNLRFIHYGRLVFHKGTALIIEALSRTSFDVCLDVVGSGPELERCRIIVATLGLQGRVRFLPWYANHSQLFESFSAYRGVVLPSIEDANGIVVQEAMALGLPPICLDWGGPQLLVEHGVSGYLIETSSRKQIISDMARYMDELSQNGELAERFSEAARSRAELWRWSRVARQWIDLYPDTTVSVDS